jgi:hypothetical protein
MMPKLGTEKDLSELPSQSGPLDPGTELKLNVLKLREVQAASSGVGDSFLEVDSGSSEVVGELDNFKPTETAAGPKSFGESLVDDRTCTDSVLGGIKLASSLASS